MKNKPEPDVPKCDVKVYYARPMDGIDGSKIIEDEHEIRAALSRKGFSIVNPYRGQDIQIEDAEKLVHKNTELLKNSDVFLANLSLRNYTYVGAVFEIVQAAELGIPIVLCIDNSNLENRYYLRYFCSFICRSIDEAVEYMWRCCTPEGIAHQLKEEKEFYDKIATERGKVTRKPYQSKESDIEKYERERRQLKDKLRHYCRDKNVLELGCGTGEWTQVMVQVARSVTCIESSRNMITRAKERLGEVGSHLHFIQEDFFDERFSVEASDAIVFYFTLSFLPPLLQNRLLSLAKKWVSTDGYFLFGESIQISTLPSIGLGRQRIQTRRASGKAYAIYKEHFTPYRLRKLLDASGVTIMDLPEDVRWFTFCAALT